MSDIHTRPREVQRTFGRVYQIRPGQSGVAIDWQPPSPIIGCKVLNHGQAVFHPTEGKVVRFPRAIRRGCGATTIAVRTALRPDLLELFDLAMKMEAELASKVAGTRIPSSPAPRGTLSVASTQPDCAEVTTAVFPRDDGPADTLFIDRRSVIPHPAVGFSVNPTCAEELQKLPGSIPRVRVPCHERLAGAPSGYATDAMQLATQRANGSAGKAGSKRIKASASLRSRRTPGSSQD